MYTKFERVGVVVGGMLGDEGKGKVTQWLLDQYTQENRMLCCIRSSGGSNTGASVYVDDKKIALHMLPVGAFRKDCMVYIGPNVYINLAVLAKEIGERMALGFTKSVYIAENAHVVFGTHIRADGDKEQKQGLGSTKNGTSVAASLKYGYRGYTIGQIEKDPRCLTSTTLIGDCPISVEDREDALNNLQRIKEAGGRLIKPTDFFKSLNPHSAIVIEGSQGVGLDVNHGLQYPYVSSGSFTTYGLLDGVGVMLAPHDVVMCMKPYVSYFGKQELHPFEEPDFRTFAGEFGSTTKRPRKLSWLDLRWLEEWASLVRPTHLVINHFDTINWFSQHDKAFYLHDKTGDATAILQEVWKDGKITRTGQYLVDMIQDVVEADKVYVGIGPKKEDIVGC